MNISKPTLSYPLKSERWSNYLSWAVDSYLSAMSALPKTQIHTHMYYWEFDDIIRDVEATKDLREGINAK